MHNVKTLSNNEEKVLKFLLENVVNACQQEEDGDMMVLPLGPDKSIALEPGEFHYLCKINEDLVKFEIRDTVTVTKEIIVFSLNDHAVSISKGENGIVVGDVGIYAYLDIPDRPVVKVEKKFLSLLHKNI